MMDIILASLVAQSPEHPILPKASTYDLQALRVDWDHGNAIVEIVVSTHEDYKILRFDGVEQLYVPGGDLIASTRLIIKDLENCQNASHHFLPICVGGSLSDSNVLRFWASAVTTVNNFRS